MQSKRMICEIPSSAPSGAKSASNRHFFCALIDLPGHIGLMIKPKHIDRDIGFGG
jgi:hypothetical protein